MQLPPLVLALVALSLSVGCGSDKDDTEDTAETGTPDTDTGNTGFDPTGPCDGGTWGAIADPENAIHVRADGSDDGDGSVESPLASIAAALELTRARAEDRIIALGPGTFETNIILAHDLGDGRSDDGTTIQGCSAAETLLEDATAASVISVHAAQDVVVEGICTHGGKRGILISSAASASLSDVVIEEAYGVGLLVLGNGTQVTLAGVEVYGTLPFTDGNNGYGLAFQEGAAVAMSGGGAYDNTGIGILISDVDDVSLSGVAVEGTLQDGDGLFGRGVQIQDYAVNVAIEDLTLADNHDAGLFALRTQVLTMSGCTITGTLAGTAPDSGDATGDGIVVSRGDGNLNPGDYVATLEGNTVTGSARAGIVIDGTTTAVSANDLSANGFTQDGTSLVSQGPAAVSGDDTVAALEEAEALSLNLEPAATVELTDAP
ncbi:MAG: right-handed parallel beta-helix repeat-containing protein [Pseudomonadota bacterium]